MNDDSTQEPEAATNGRERRARPRFTRVSGKSTVLIVALCLATSAVLLPTVLRLDRWVETFVVLAVWWLVWTCALARLLYRGTPLRDDHKLGAAKNWFGSFSLSDLGGADTSGDGCLILLAFIALLGLAWLLIELLIPALAVAIYIAIYAMLARVANDRHGCRGRLWPSLCWAAACATFYTAPLVVMVWLVQWAFIN